MDFSIIAAVDDRNGIGKNGSIPWNCPADRKFFAETTKKAAEGKRNAIIMGRVTWESLPRRPLPDRLNVIVSSRQLEVPPGVVVVSSLDTALTHCRSDVTVEHAWVIGGERLYAEALRHTCLRACVLTHIPGDHGCDRHFPTGYELEPYSPWFFPFLRDIRKSDFGRTPENLDYQWYYASNEDEAGYLDMLSAMLSRPTRPNRTGIPTRGYFAQQLQFRLHDSYSRPILPIMTTKTVPLRVVAEELFWFLRGGTDARDLQARNVHIWDGNSTREFLDHRGLTGYATGELGPVYGAQWRHWGAEYIPERERQPGESAFRGAGVDQIQRLIDGLKSDPYDRRHIVSAWNVSDLPKMALPPCHVMAQFYVEPDTADKPAHLSCHLYMRSADMFLGVPFNIVSYALLTHFIAQQTGLLAKQLVITMGDCHVYENHLEAVAMQLKRPPRRFPTIEIRPRDSIDQYTVADITIHGYYPHPTIKAPMAV